MSRAAFFVLAVAMLPFARAQVTGAEAGRILKEVAQKALDAKSYAFEGELGLLGQRADGPAKTLSQAKIELAVGPEGRYKLRVNAPDKDEYLLVSNGQKTWAYVPKLKQYTEEESGALDDRASDDEEAAGDTERDLAETYSRLVVPLLGQMLKTTASVDTNGVAEVKYGNKKQKWPVVRAMSRRGADRSLALTELTVDPSSLDIGRMAYKTALYSGAEKTVLNLTVDFSRFQIGGSLPDSTFEFEPPKNAKLAEALPIPGQTGSFLLNKAAPDFELKAFGGERVRLAELRGRPVLIAFWATWCGPCRKEMISLVKLHDELKSSGLVLLGINDEGKSVAGKFAGDAGVAFPILDDSGLKAHKLYRVRSIPSLFLIDPTGKVVRFFRGSHDYAAIRSALKSVGL